MSSAQDHRPVLAPARVVRAAMSLTVWFCPVILPAQTQPARPELPRVLIDTRLTATPVTGETIIVSGGGDVQAALDRAAPGDEIVLAAGATFTGNFVLPARPADGRWTTIRSSRMDDLPAEGNRVGPEHAAAMPRIVDPSGNGAFRTVTGTCYWRLMGLEITVAPDVENAWALVQLGSGGPEQRALEQVPHHLILDRVLIYGDPRRNCFRCVALNGAHCAIVDSHLSEGHAEGYDAQAVCGWNGPGPFKIVNNRLEGSGENVMFGGADPSIPDLVPSDIEFRGNQCCKPLTWNVDHPSYGGIAWTVKNLFELKNAQRVLIEGNLFENNWAHGQNGTAILFTVRNQDGRAPWSVVQDVTMVHNTLRNAPTAFVIMGEDSPHPSQMSRRFLIRHNVFAGIERTAFMITAGAEDVEIDHNTFVPTEYSAFVLAGLGGRDAAGQVVGKPCPRFKLTNNIFGFGLYGVTIDGGLNTFAEAFPELTWQQNLFVGYGEGRAQWASEGNRYPPGSLFEPRQTGSGGQGDADWAAVGFVDFDGGNYRLSPASPYRGRATDGSDLGANPDLAPATSAAPISSPPAPP